MVKTKKFIGFILAVIVSLGLCLFSACSKNGGTKDAPQTVSYNFFISSTALSLEKGQSEKLECRYGDKQIVFTSSDTQVALVDQNGTVTAVAVGETYITAKAEGVAGAEKICKISVIENNYAVTFDRGGEVNAVLGGGQVTLDFTATVYKNGEKSYLTATYEVTPEGCVLKTEGRAARITFSAAGEYVITATYKNASAKITVKVTENIDG